MAIPSDVEILNESTDRAVQDILGLLAELQRRSLGTDGYTFGTEHMSREDRILMFLDDVRSGALDHLKVLNEKFYIAYLRQNKADVAASPQMQPTGAS